MRHRKAVLTIEGMPLVTVPVGIANARKSDNDVSLSICFEDGRKANMIYRNAVTGEVSDTRPATRGVKIGADGDGDLYGLIDVDAWNALNSAIKLHVLGFIDRDEANHRIDRVDEAHYVQIQSGHDAGALAMVLRAMQNRDAAAVTKFSVGTKERLGVLIARDDGALVLLTFVYSARENTPDADVLAARDKDVPATAVEQAEKLIDATTLDADVLDTATDDALAERMKIIEAAARGEKPIPAAEKKDDAPSGDLAALLEASLADVAPTKGKGGKAKTKAKAA